MANIDITDQGGGGTPINTGVLQLENGVAMDTALRYVADQANTKSQLLLATNATTVEGTLKIKTDNVEYIDIEDGIGSNRFTISRPALGQKVALDFASNPVGSTTPVGAIRTFQDGVNLSDAMTFIENGSIGIGTTAPVGLLHMYKAATNVRLAIDGDTGFNRLISYRTGALPRWGLYADNTAESGSNAGTNFAIRRYNDAGTFVAAPLSINRATGLTTISESLNLGGSELQNFSANLETLAANTTFNAGNTATYNGSVVQVSGARTFTFDNALPLGFTMTVIQTDANQTTFVGAGAAVVNNRQSHTKNNGQYSVISIIKLNTNQFILGGDTAA
jgi:hypothetical protein